jgi:Cu/Ag efflux protein CusF
MKFASIPFAVGLLAALGLASPAFAASEHGAEHAEAATHPAATMSEGTVRKIDKAAGKLTIAHGPLENLGMPPMTMVFRVSDQAMLDRVRTGDRIRFTAARSDGVFSVIALEAAE